MVKDVNKTATTLKEIKNMNKKSTEDLKESKVKNTSVAKEKTVQKKSTDIVKTQSKDSESIAKQQILSNQLYALVCYSGCTDEELLKAFAVAVCNCILTIHQGDTNLSRIVINNFSDHIKELIVQHQSKKQEKIMN